MTDVIRHDNADDWNALVRHYGGHPLQLWGWGEVKAAHGWSVVRLQVGEGGAQVLLKRLPKPFGPLAYIPRGPFGSVKDTADARKTITEYIKRTYRPTVCTVEPDTIGPLGWKGWRKTANTILIPRTAVLDLKQSQEDMLAAMTKKTRQYIRKSEKESVVIAQAATKADIDECLAIYRQTAKRAGFDLHGDDYYHDIFRLMGDDSPVYTATSNGKVVAFLWPIVTPDVAFELYGGMNDEGQAMRANYILKWRVIQAMKARGVHRYDVNGLLNDGVTTFKKGFIPDETILSGTYDLPMSPLYPVWNRLLPTAKRIVRTLAKRST